MQNHTKRIVDLPRLTANHRSALLTHFKDVQELIDFLSIKKKRLSSLDNIAERGAESILHSLVLYLLDPCNQEPQDRERLRDEIAMSAGNALLMLHRDVNPTVANLAYAFADEMLRHRGWSKVKRP